MDSLTYTQLLRRNRSFRRLWIGQVISELGNWFNFIAALGLVRVVSHAAPEVTTIVLISRLVPFTLFLPLAGAFVDRWSRRTVMIVTDLVRVVIALGFLFVHGPEDLWIAYVCTAALSVFGTFFEAAKNASHRRSPDHDYYADVKQHLDAKLATISMARKLARRCFHVLRAVDPELVYATP